MHWDENGGERWVVRTECAVHLTTVQPARICTACWWLRFSTCMLTPEPRNPVPEGLWALRDGSKAACQRYTAHFRALPEFFAVAEWKVAMPKWSCEFPLAS